MLIWTGKEKLTLAEHTAIIECIAAHDPDGAEKAMVKHLDRSSALYMHHDETRAADPAPPSRRRAAASRSKRPGGSDPDGTTKPAAAGAPQRRTRIRTTA
jgi:hypothetical protein